ncbi:MAG: glutamate--tRNA ligase [Alphaproteobacteria bacterium]|nr:glutamate--tRNA ligase [Alphaproteobacteria bacterium]
MSQSFPAAAPRVATRFAPSPTGYLHIGNVRVALMNWLYARQQGGTFLLRLDDTDRATQTYIDAIYRDVGWLGIDYDTTFKQSDCMAHYDAAVASLKLQQRLYPCYETSEVLALKRKTQLAQGKPPVYDRAALRLTQQEIAAYEAAGVRPHWRFRLEETPIAWDDFAAGPVAFEAGHVSDPVLIRADGRPLYTLTSVADDGRVAISHIVRGADHIANTAVQVQLFHALGYAVPRFAHYPLLADAEGKNLSKRVGSLALDDLRRQGIMPMTIASVLVALGTAQSVSGDETMAKLVERFVISGYGKARPRFGIEAFEEVNPLYFRQLSLEEVKAAVRDCAETLVVTDASDAVDANDSVAASDPVVTNGSVVTNDSVAASDAMTEQEWAVLRTNVVGVHDLALWHPILQKGWGQASAPTTDQAPTSERLADMRLVLETFQDALPNLPAPPTDEGCAQWLKATMSLLPKPSRGKTAFGVLRAALTGRADGPSLAVLLAHLARLDQGEISRRMRDFASLL